MTPRGRKKSEVIEVSKPDDVLTIVTGPSTVPKDPMTPPVQPPDVNSSAPATAFGRANLGPPTTGIGPSADYVITAFGKAKMPAPAGVEPYTEGVK